ncbi:MAG: alpha-amylase family glycosyl hydrolase [Polyangiaceae bacterium]
MARNSLKVFGFLTALGLAAACASTEEPIDRPNLKGTGGVAASSGSAGASSGGCDPGAGASVGSAASTGSGASGATVGCGAGGAGGAGGEPGPPQCDDSLKRCQQEFTYPVGSESSVELRGSFAANGWDVGVPLSKQGSVWSAMVEVPYAQSVQYKFLIDGSQWVTDPGNPNKVSDGLGGENSELAAVSCATWSCVPPTGTFDWRDSILYFVFVDRFFNGDTGNDGPPISQVESAAAYQGGDIAGVRKKIAEGYFTDLGVNTLWLTAPIDNADSAGVGTDGKYYSAYHGYWPKNLDQTEPRFGTLAELQALVTEAHAAGLRVILDYAMNHVHIDSPVYQNNKGWFWLLDENGKHCVCGEGCGWEGADGKRCWFRDYLPDFNFTLPAARKFSIDNAVQWVKDTGVDGFRLDAVKHIEDAWVTELRSRVTSDIEPGSGEHFYMVGETFTGNRDDIKYYVDPVTKLDGQFDFPLRAKIVSSLLVRSTPLTDLEGFLASNDNYYGAGVMSTFVGNHDVPRSIHFAEDQPLWGNEWADGKDRSWSGQPGLPGNLAPFERLNNAYTLIFTLRGVPLLYYGDEIAMAGAGDPDNRRMMQWTGLSAGQTLVRDHVKALTALRAKHPALRRGQRTSLSSSANTLAYRMQHNADDVIVIINRGDGTESVGGLPAGSYTDELGGGSASGPSVSVPARSSMVLVAK